MELSLSKEYFPLFDAEELSRKISEFINNRYSWSRTRATRSLTRKLKYTLYPVRWPAKSIGNNQIIENWSLLISLINNFRDWDVMDKRKLVELINLKQTGREIDHIAGMQKFPLFWKSLKNIDN
jgi:hypothetical protein